MKKNYFLRAAVLLLVLCTLMSGVFMGTGTMAKYIAAGDGDAVARVARFSVKVVNFVDVDKNGNNDITNAALGTEIAKKAGESATLEASKVGEPNCTRSTQGAHIDAGCTGDAPCKILSSVCVFGSIFSNSYAKTDGTYAGVNTVEAGTAANSVPKCKNQYENCTSPQRGVIGTPHENCTVGNPCEDLIAGGTIPPADICTPANLGTAAHAACTAGSACLVIGLHPGCNADKPCKVRPPKAEHNKIVAPGTGYAGKTADKLVEVWNESEVAVRITLELVGVKGVIGGGVPAGTPNQVPLRFKNAAGTWTGIGSGANQIPVGADGMFATPIKLGTSIDLGPNQTFANKVALESTGIEWEWQFQGSDSVYNNGRTGTITAPAILSDTDFFDTALGIAAREAGPIEVGFVFRVTATQID